jgi:hypothetical protein
MTKRSCVGRMEQLEARRLMAGDIMFAAKVTAFAESAPDYASKFAEMADIGASAHADILAGTGRVKELSGDPDAGDPLTPDTNAEKDYSGPKVTDKLGGVTEQSGDADATDPTSVLPGSSAPSRSFGAGKVSVAGTPSLAGLVSSYDARRGDRQSWAMDGGGDDKDDDDQDDDDQDDEQCKTDQCHTSEKKEDDSEQKKRETVSPFGNPDKQQGQDVEEEKEDDSGVGATVNDSPFFETTEHEADTLDGEPFQGQQVGGRYPAKTPVPDAVGIEGGTAQDAARKIDNARSGFVGPRARYNNALSREALNWSRGVDMFFKAMGEQVNPLINPSPDNGESAPPAGEAPLPDNGFKDPPKPSFGRSRLRGRR